MADDAENVDDAPEDGAETESEDAGAKKKAGLKKLILFVGLPVVILLLGGVAGGLLFLGGGGEEDEAAAMAEAGDAAQADAPVDPAEALGASFDAMKTWELEPPVTVNITDPDGRYLAMQIEIALVYTDERITALLAREAVQGQLRDSYTEFLRALRVEDIDGSMGSYRIRAELQRRTNLVLSPLEIDDVLLPSIIMN
jgi:flagellar FliL protein